MLEAKTSMTTAGKPAAPPAALPNSVELVVVRRLPVPVIAVRDEEWIEGQPVDFEAFIRALRDQKRAGIFAFARPLPDCQPRHPFHFDWDNAAVADTGNFTRWWESLPQETRKNVRRSQRRGVSVRRVDFDDQLVQGITKLYNETPVRQGRKFWHYGKDFDQVKAANVSYLDRSEFFGAFLNGELIGFIKFVMVNNVARIMQILSLEAHTDKRPTNALLAAAVERCCEKRATCLVYGKYVYGKKENSAVTEFKRRNGFSRLSFPRYYVPLTAAGALAIRCRLHRELAQLVPEAFANWFLTARAVIYRRRFHLQAKASSQPGPAEISAGRYSDVT